MKTIIDPERQVWEKAIERPRIPTTDLDKVVQEVFDRVKTQGNTAVKQYTEKFDGVSVDNPEVPVNEIKNAINEISVDLRNAIDLAVKNIRKFHEAQKTGSRVIETMTGVKCWQKPSPVEKVGLYIPGGTAPLFSTVLMLAVPAQIAGCREVVLCSPPDKNGRLHPAILYAASITGVTGIFRVGGVQAIAAMAFGTESIPSVYKIFGPGNQYVTAAKQLVNRLGVAIDMPAGPSEVMLVADSSSNPAFVASDLLAQAEHGTDSHVVMVTKDEGVIEKVQAELGKQLEELPRKDIASQSIGKSALIKLKNNDEIVDMINLYAPEHLILSNNDYRSMAEKIINAGSVFMGEYTPESAGDYASGTNHTLPTYGYARAYSGVNLDSFVKKITFQEITREGLQKLGPAIEIMAAEEELQAHKNAVSIRLK